MYPSWERTEPTRTPTLTSNIGMEHWASRIPRVESTTDILSAQTYHRLLGSIRMGRANWAPPGIIGTKMLEYISLRLITWRSARSWYPPQLPVQPRPVQHRRRQPRVQPPLLTPVIFLWPAIQRILLQVFSDERKTRSGPNRPAAAIEGDDFLDTWCNLDFWACC